MQTPCLSKWLIGSPVELSCARQPHRSPAQRWHRRQIAFRLHTSCRASLWEDKAPQEDAPGHQHTCYGCGTALQTQNLQLPGYIQPDIFQLKKKHRQLRQVLCGRCQELSHGQMRQAVAGTAVMAPGSAGRWTGHCAAGGTCSTDQQARACLAFAIERHGLTNAMCASAEPQCDS